MHENVKFYIADYEESIVEAISRLVSKAFPSSIVRTFENGVDLWEAIAKEKGSIIIISDYNIPGINGLQVLKKLRNESNIKDAYFIMISSANDKDLPLKAMQTGTDEYLSKPFTIDQLLAKLKSASKFTNQKIREIELVAQLSELNKSIAIQAELFENSLYKMQISRLESKELEIKRIVSASTFIAKNLSDDLEEVKNITRAAKLCYLNKIHLPDNLIQAAIFNEGIVKNPILEKIPQQIKDIFDGILGFEEVERILYHIYENFEGSGIPGRLQGPEIPLGSRILRIALDFEFLMPKHLNKSNKVLEILWSLNYKLYDFKIIAYYDQYLGFLNTRSVPPMKPLERKVSTKELESSMVLSRDINSLSGHKLISANTRLDTEMIEKIRLSSSTDSIIGNIFVRNID
jgi:response regulator RpfG family c-di-GMP phosphodiesterase